MRSMDVPIAADGKTMLAWSRLVVWSLLLTFCFACGVTLPLSASDPENPHDVSDVESGRVLRKRSEAMLSKECRESTAALPVDPGPVKTEVTTSASSRNEDQQTVDDELTTATPFKPHSVHLFHSHADSVIQLHNASTTVDQNSSETVKEHELFPESPGDESLELHVLTTGSKSATPVGSSPAPLPHLRLAYTKSGTRWMGAPVAKSTPALSCYNRCEDQGVSVSERAEVGEGEHQCYCDNLCSLLKDCCQDFFPLCQKLSTVHGVFFHLFIEVRRGISNIEHQLWHPSFDPYTKADHTTAGFHRYGSCHAVNYLENKRRKTSQIMLIDKCLANFTEADVVEECEKRTLGALFAFPVSHRWQPAFTFKNIFCALCHEVEFPDILMWHVQLSCRSEDVADLSNATFRQLQELANSNASSCSVIPIIPQGVRLRFCIPEKQLRRCPGDFLNPPGHVSIGNTEVPESEWADSETVKSIEQENTPPVKSTSAAEGNFLPVELAALCNSYLSPVLIKDTVYANTHCALCNHVTPEETEDIFENHYTINNDKEEEEKETVVGSSSSQFMTVSEISFEGGEILYTLPGDNNIRTHHNQCPGEDLLTLFLPFCREPSCPEGFYPSRCSGLGLTCSLSRREKVCALRRFRFTGDTLATSVTGFENGSVPFFYFSLQLFIPEDGKSVLNLITRELLSKAFDETMKHHCNCRRPPWVKLYRTEKMPNALGSGTRKWILTLKWYCPKHIEFKYIRYVSFYLNSYLGSRGDVSLVRVWNTESGGRLCEENAKGVLKLSGFAFAIGMDLYVQSFDHDFDYDLREKDIFCFFDARTVAFKSSAFNLINYGFTDAFFLCWSEEMRGACGIENTEDARKRHRDSLLTWRVEAPAMGDISPQNVNVTGATPRPLTLTDGASPVMRAMTQSCNWILLSTVTVSSISGLVYGYTG